jgi:hypothetical protein
VRLSALQHFAELATRLPMGALGQVRVDAPQCPVQSRPIPRESIHLQTRRRFFPWSWRTAGGYPLRKPQFPEEDSDASSSSCSPAIHRLASCSCQNLSTGCSPKGKRPPGRTGTTKIESMILAGSRLPSVQFGNGVAQLVFDGSLTIGRHYLGSIQFPNIETVNRRAAIRANLRAGNVQVELGKLL